jgi:hypothetical protein
MRHPITRFIGKAVAVLLLGTMMFMLTGCGTVEGDSKNSSSRPWNTPKQWEGGLPGGLMEGR